MTFALAGLQGAEDPLDPALLPYLQQDRVSGHLLRHPLVFMPLPGKSLNHLANRMYHDKLARLEAAERSGKWHEVVFLHERPYRLHAILQYRDEIPSAMFWELAASVYRDSENIHECRYEWLDLLGSAIPQREHMMSQEERQMLAALPDSISVYRGSRQREDEDDLGFSWTTAPDKARWYATRFLSAGTGYVFHGEIARTDVIAIFKGGDDEIIALPHSIRVIHVRPVAAKKR